MIEKLDKLIESYCNYSKYTEYRIQLLYKDKNYNKEQVDEKSNEFIKSNKVHFKKDIERICRHEIVRKEKFFELIECYCKEIKQYESIRQTYYKQYNKEWVDKRIDGFIDKENSNFKRHIKNIVFNNIDERN